MRRFVILFSVLSIAACGGDETEPEPAEEECPVGEQYHPIQGECVRLAEPTNNDSTTDAGTTTASGDAGDDGDMADSGTEEDSGSNLTCQTDEDGDGAYAMECGGDDCDDTDDRRAPMNTELCDEVDNDCDDELNEELDCSVYAHSDTRLYLVDFFAGTYEDLGETVDQLWDIDTHPDGTLYGIAGNYLHTYNPGTGTWTQAPQALSFTETANGFCIDNDGTAFATTAFTLRTVDLDTGASNSIGSMAPASSSGDCVVNKGNVLFMSSNHTTPDSFARIDGDTGASTIVGQTGFDGIWGLTAAYNRVFGMTDQGHVVEIDVADGTTTVLHQYDELSFFGAASTPGR
jgi:hypothetical protein